MRSDWSTGGPRPHPRIMLLRNHVLCLRVGSRVGLVRLVDDRDIYYQVVLVRIRSLDLGSLFLLGLNW